MPVTRLGRLAIRTDTQGQGLGRLLLADALNRAQPAAQAVGSAGIFVDAKDDMNSRFYQGFGFQLCQDQPLKLYFANVVIKLLAAGKNRSHYWPNFDLECVEKKRDLGELIASVDQGDIHILTS